MTVTMTINYRHWAFTLNNYLEDDVIELRRMFNQPRPKVRYLVFGKEVGASGTRHLQGFVSFANARRVESLHMLLRRSAHWEVARNPPAAAIYCKKDGDFEEFGTSPIESRKGQGIRTDLEALRDAIVGGQTDRKALRQDFLGVCAKYPNFVSQLIMDQVPAPECPDFPLRIWQSQLVEDLRRPPDDRTVIFVVDKKGNSGKSWFSKYYQKVYGRTVSIQPGKKADMVYAFISVLTPDTKVVFLDAPRSKQGDYIQYDFLEELKDGRILNTKYESRMVTFKVPHVVVFMNEDPDESKLSADRYKIINVTMTSCMTSDEVAVAKQEKKRKIGNL